MTAQTQSHETLNWIKDKFRNERPLSVQEEAELFKIICDKEQPEMVRNSARANILHSNMKFVIQVAQQFYNDTLTKEELINEGAIGLWRAVESFDYTRGVRFITYAVWWIKAFIARAISEKGSLVRLPLNQQTRLHKEIRKCSNKCELDDEFRTLDAISGKHVSLSSNINEDSSLKLEDVIKDENNAPTDRNIEIEFQKNFTDKILNKLPERENKILSLIYGLNGMHSKSIREISQTLGLSRERIRQLRDQAVGRIRNLNCDGHLNPILKEFGCKV